jgi:hypothetical protein
VFTTVEELLRWDANFYDPKVGGPAMLTELLTTGTLADGKALTYALGLMVDDYRGHRTVSHGGAWGGYRAELLRFPEQHFSVATLCNLGTTNPSALSRRVADVYLADVLEPRREAPAARTASSGDRVQVPEIILRPIAGTYRNATSRATRMLVLDGGSLYLAIGGGRYELAPRSATEFAVLGAPVEISIAIEPPAAGAPRRMRWMASGQEPLVFEQIELVTPTAAELAVYTGSYFSDELETTHTIALEGDKLVLQRRGAGSQTLRPLTRDEFAIGSMTVRFMRGERDVVTGYQLDLGRIRNLRFQRVSEER